MKKGFSLLLAVIMVCSLFSGCSGSPDDTGSLSSGSTAQITSDGVAGSGSSDAGSSDGSSSTGDTASGISSGDTASGISSGDTASGTTSGDTTTGTSSGGASSGGSSGNSSSGGSGSGSGGSNSSGGSSSTGGNTSSGGNSSSGGGNNSSGGNTSSGGQTDPDPDPDPSTDITSSEEALGLIVGEMLTLSASPSGAKVLVNNSGMSGLFSPNHLHAAFNSNKATERSLVSENMYRTSSPTTITLDVGKAEALGKMFIWNYNDPSDLNSGMKQVQIQYSTNNSTWKTLGTYTLAKCSADDNTEYGGNVATNRDGENLPIDFGGVTARYIRIVPKSNWGGSGYGLSEVRVFRAKTRPSSNTIIYPEAFTPSTDSNAENAVNNSGMNSTSGTTSNRGTHSNSAADMWRSTASAGDSLLVLNLDGTYPISSITLWNYNDPSNLGAGIKEFDVYYTSGEAAQRSTKNGKEYMDFNKGSWTELGTYTLPKGTGSSGMAASLTIDFGGKHAQHIKIVPKSNYGGSGYGLSEVRVFAASGWAVEPARAWTGLFSSSGSFAYQGNTSSTPFATNNNGRGWIGGDGIMSVSLNGGQSSGSASSSSKTLFTFQDSFEGNFGNYRSFGMTHGYGDSAGFSLGMRNMAYMMLQGNLPDPRNAQFYLELENGKSNGHPLGNIYPGSYWLADSTVIDGAVYTIANRFFKLEILGSDFYKHALGSDGFVDMNQEPQKIYSNSPNNVGGCNYESILEEGNYIYLFGKKGGRLYVSRTTKQNYKTMTGFTYWNGSSWVSNSSQARAISNYEPGNEFNVVYMSSGPFAGKYLNIFTDRSIWGTISYGVSDKITGPFTKVSGNEGKLYWATERYKVSRYSYTDKNEVYEQWNYNAKAQPAISKSGELLITYHFGLKDDRVKPWGYFSANAKEYEHPTFINLIQIR